MVEVATLAPSGDDPANGFVQLPTDTQRSATVGYRRECLLPTSLQESIDASLAAAICAVLFRYTQQESIGLDLRLSSCRKLTLRCPVQADDSVSAITARIAAASRDAHATAGANSNIALSFLQPGEVLDESDSHDVHFLVRTGISQLEVAYNASLFETATVQRLVDAVVRAIHIVRNHPDTRAASLPVVSDADRHTIMVDWDSGRAEYPAVPIHRIFEKLARHQPNSPAASFEGYSLTYGELDSLSNQLAHYLIGNGVKPSGAVAVCVLPSTDIVVAFLAIWKAGAVYVPLDPTHPEALIATILDEVKPRVVLTQSKLRPLTAPDRHNQYCFDTDAHLTKSLPMVAPDVQVTLDDPAYVLYTSGTTGKPKGVDARHENLAHYIHVAQQKYRFGPSDIFCSLARYTFSISLFELVLPLACGASVRLLVRDDVLAPNRLALTLAEVTVVHAGPSLLGNLFRYLHSGAAGRKTFPNMRHASSGGDLVPPTIMEEMKQVFENAELFVIYGCTEISCMGCTYPILRNQKATRTFVGMPFPDVAVRVADPRGNPVPFGAVGEICFSGKGVVRGYLDRPELTAEKFVLRDGRRFYLTGDMGRLHPDGNVEILGRRDYQVQLRGIRVELPGIENKVREIALAEQCAMVVKRLSDQDVRLVAFTVKPRETTLPEFRRTLAAHLPDYMLPQALVAIDALPLTRNGKLDRNALQELPWENQQAGAPREAPRTTIERQVAEAFAKALGVAEVGLDDDFFDRGGHSLLAVVMLQELENRLGLNLSPGLIFESPTVRSIAAQATSSMSRVPKPIPLSAARDKPALYMLLGVQIYRPFAKHLEGRFSVYGVYAGSELIMFEALDKSPTVDELASEYIAIIRQHQPSGPYRLAGISFGGIVAYEVAQQLRASGEEVAFVGLIDAVLPEIGRRHRLRQLGRLFSLPFPKMMRTIGAKLKAGLRRGPRPRSEFTRYVPEEKLAPIDDIRQSAYARAAEMYVTQIQPYTGNLELVVSGRRLERDPLQSPDCGWRNINSSIQVHPVDSDHLGLVEEPAVGQVAEIFLKSLNRCANHHCTCEHAKAPASSLGLADGLLGQST
jgi:amino acid adenylation domain-containing protein